MARAASDMLSSRETQEQAAELAALGRLLDISANSFSLSVAVCNSPALRDYCIETVRKSHPDLAVVSLPRGCVDVYGEVTIQLETTHPPALFITGIEHSVSSASEDHPTLRSLNASRDLWETRFPCPVVFWVPAYVAALLPSQAPDFWRYRSHGFEFVAPREIPAPAQGMLVEARLPLAANLDIDQKQFRIAELEQRISDLAWPPPEPLVPYAITWMQELGFLYGRVSRLEEARKTIERALSVCHEDRWPEVKALLLNDLGNIAADKNDLDTAEHHYRDALTINQRIGRADGVAICLGNLGVLNRRRGNLDAAEEDYAQALEIYRNAGRRDGQSNQLGNLGNVAVERGDLDKAETLYREALEIDRVVGRLEGQAAQLGNLGLVYLQRGELDEAERLLEEAVALNRKLGWTEGLAARLAHLAAIRVKRGDLDGAEELFQQALDIERRLGNIEPQVQRLCELGDLAEARGDIERAREVWTGALDLSETHGLAEKSGLLKAALEKLPVV